MTRTGLFTVAISFSTLFVGHAMAANNDSETREQVKAELAEAIRTGNIATDESGLRLNEQFALLYPEQRAASTITRAQVQAELEQAVRAGDVVIGESAVRLADEFPHNYEAKNNVVSLSRAQVKAELAEAISNGSHYQPIEP